MTSTKLGAWAAGSCGLAVAAGAFGAHGLAEIVDSRGLELWETASRYLMYAGLGALVVTAIETRAGTSSLGGWLLLAGGAVFAASLGTLAVGGPRWWGAVAPVGGMLMISGFVMTSFALWRADPR